MSNSRALNCRGRFFENVKMHTSTSRKLVDIYYSWWQIATLADFFTMTK